MKNLVTIFSMLVMSSSVFAASESCSRQLDFLMGRQYEIARLETSAISRKVQGDDKVYQGLQDQADQHRRELEVQKDDFKTQCSR